MRNLQENFVNLIMDLEKIDKSFDKNDNSLELVLLNLLVSKSYSSKKRDNVL